MVIMGEEEDILHGEIDTGGRDELLERDGIPEGDVLDAEVVGGLDEAGVGVLMGLPLYIGVRPVSAL